MYVHLHYITCSEYFPSYVTPTVCIIPWKLGMFPGLVNIMLPTGTMPCTCGLAHTVHSYASCKACPPALKNERETAPLLSTRSVPTVLTYSYIYL